MSRGAFDGPANGGEVTAEGRSRRHERQAEGQRAEGQAGYFSMEPGGRSLVCAPEKQGGGQQAAYQADTSAFEHSRPGAGGASPGQLICRQPGGGQAHPADGKGDAKGVNRKQQLVNAHAFGPDFIGKIGGEGHTQQPHRHRRGG